jgi:hypothetical protein
MIGCESIFFWAEMVGWICIGNYLNACIEMLYMMFELDPSNLDRCSANRRLLHGVVRIIVVVIILATPCSGFRSRERM